MLAGIQHSQNEVKFDALPVDESNLVALRAQLLALVSSGDVDNLSSLYRVLAQKKLLGSNITNCFYDALFEAILRGQKSSVIEWFFEVADLDPNKHHSFIRLHNGNRVGQFTVLGFALFQDKLDLFRAVLPYGANAISIAENAVIMGRTNNKRKTERDLLFHYPEFFAIAMKGGVLSSEMARWELCCFKAALDCIVGRPRRPAVDDNNIVYTDKLVAIKIALAVLLNGEALVSPQNAQVREAFDADLKALRTHIGVLQRNHPLYKQLNLLVQEMEIIQAVNAGKETIGVRDVLLKIALKKRAFLSDLNVATTKLRVPGAADVDRRSLKLFAHYEMYRIVYDSIEDSAAQSLSDLLLAFKDKEHGRDSEQRSYGTIIDMLDCPLKGISYLLSSFAFWESVSYTAQLLNRYINGQPGLVDDADHKPSEDDDTVKIVVAKMVEDASSVKLASPPAVSMSTSHG